MVCGLDSDADGYPDTELKCDDQYCTMVRTYNIACMILIHVFTLKDACPETYSVASDGTQDATICKVGHGLDILGMYLKKELYNLVYYILQVNLARYTHVRM